MDRCVDHLAEVMRRNVGRHSNSDARRAVDEQVGKRRRQHDGLEERAVVGRAERNCTFFDLAEQLSAERLEPGLGVAHGRWVVAVERAEVAVPVY